jgi:cation:H+ antiporter
MMDTHMGPLTVVLFVVGVVALVAGAEAMVRGAARLATRTGLSPIVIGLTVVAFGTSAPELAVSVGASINGEADLAIGNVVGSNIANVLLVLGHAALVGGGLVVAQRIVRVDVPLLIGASVLVWLLALNNKLGRLEGLLLIALLVGYVIWTVRSAQRGNDANIEAEYADALDHEKVRKTSALADVGYVIAGLVLLVIGAQALVGAATDIAVDLGVSQLVIGLTVVAVGTSLPEIATSILAAARGERDLAVGNAIGSNLFNLLAVLGLSAAVSPTALTVLQGAITVDMPVMIAAAVACLPLFATGYVLELWEGAVFLGFYAAYVSWLVLDATDHDLRDGYRSVMLLFVLPLVLITLTVIVSREWRRRRGDLPAH